MNELWKACLLTLTKKGKVSAKAYLATSFGLWGILIPFFADVIVNIGTETFLTHSLKFVFNSCKSNNIACVLISTVYYIIHYPCLFFSF